MKELCGRRGGRRRKEMEEEKGAGRVEGEEARVWRKYYENHKECTER